MPSKSKKKTQMKQSKPAKKNANNKFMILLLLLVAVVVIFWVLPEKNQQSTVQETLAISGCKFSTVSGNLECRLNYEAGTCNEDVTVIIQDSLNNTMIALRSDTFAMGDVSITDKLTAKLVTLPGESPIDRRSSCSLVVLNCGERTASSSCAFA